MKNVCDVEDCLYRVFSNKPEKFRERTNLACLEMLPLRDPSADANIFEYEERRKRNTLIKTRAGREFRANLI